MNNMDLLIDEQLLNQFIKDTAEDNEEYQKYLDQRASWRQKVNWEDMEHDSD